MLTGNALKLIAALSMTLDHAGLMLFHDHLLFRLLGRLAMPIYAFMIAEGCKYTRNKGKYFATVFSLGAVCQTVYWFVDHSLYFSILITFSLSILTVYALQFFKSRRDFPSFGLFALTVAAVWCLNRTFTIDYGFWGCMLPVFASLPHRTKFDRPSLSLAALSLGLLLLSMDLGNIQYFSFLAVPLLALYSGKRGKWNLKYFFYIFYPTHLVVLEAIAMAAALLR